MIYFDNAATTKIRPELIETYTRLLQEYGNPDSLHALGRRAHELTEKSREQIGRLLDVKEHQILFTSGASESNSLAIIGSALANQSRGKHIITSNVEHSSSEHAMDFLAKLGFEITRLPIHQDGSIHLDDLEKALREDTILVSLIHVNNETGAINPIEEAARLLETRPTTLFHVDITQSFTKMDIDYDLYDLISLSAHKIHGLKGSGLLLKKKPVRLEPLIQGGQQEYGLRGGTTNAPADILLAKTIRLALQEQKEAEKTVREINEFLRKKIIEIPGGHVHSPESASPYILVISFDQITSEVLQNALDKKGVAISARSTCKSSQSGANPVLMKMGLDERTASHAIRLSFSHENTLEQAEEFLAIMKEILALYGLSFAKTNQPVI